MPDGIRLGGAYYELTADPTSLNRGLQQAEQQAKRSSAAVEQSMRRMGQSTEQASLGLSSMAKSAASFGVAAVGIGSAVAIVNQSLTAIVENTQKASQAQFNLAATYRTSAASIQVFAQAQAQLTARTVTDIQEAAAAFGSLNARYAINLEQVKELTKRSADLAAVKGIKVVDAAKRLEAAMRGETESAEFLGLTLNDEYMKKFATMTAEQRKNWETLDPLIKAQIRYAEVLKQTDPMLGQAEKRAKDQVGALDRMATATTNLSVAIGKQLIPEMNAMAAATEKATGWLQQFIEAALEAARNISRGQFLPPGPAGPIQIGPDPGMPGSGPGPTPAQLDALDAGRKAAELAAAERREQAKRDLEAADKANQATAESAIKAIEAERKAKEQWYDEERSRIEARRHYQLEDIEARKDAALKALQEEKQATLDAIDEQIEQQERLKDARLAAAEAAADAAKAAITAQKEQLDLERELADRARDDEREAEDRARSTIRRTEDRAREDARRTEDREREASQEEEIRGLEALTEAREKAVEAGIAALERATDKRIRALDREAERARQNGEEALTRLERQGEAEDEAHRVRMQHLDDEQDARLAALEAEQDARLEALDTQLAALDADEQRAALARRMADLQQRLTASQQAAARARGTGTPEQIAEAREELTRALRSGNELSIENARERLVQLAGEGNAAIQKADEELAEAQQAIRDEGVEQARDAEREKLEAARDAITDTLEAARDAITKEIDARKRSEEDADRGRKRELELLQEHERAQLAATLDRLAKRKQAVTDSSAAEKRDLQERLEADRTAQQEQIRLTKERFEADGQVLRDRREAEDRLREDERLAQDQFRADERQAQDRAREDERQAQDADLARQLAAVNVALETERTATEAHYNGPNGVVTQLKRAREASEREYSARLAAVTVAYEAERKAAELKYRNPEGTGELQLLEAQRKAEMEALAARKTEYEEQAKAHHEMIVAILADLDAWIAKNGQIPRIGGDVPAQRSAGSGKSTSSSSASTPSRKSGKSVQGDLVSWLNDAMDITGVGDDWLAGLHKLVQLESGGDPHNQNPQDVISNGVNYGPAKGLLQMLQSTFAANRDKDLPNDIFDPVANAVAAIRYIKGRYGHVDKAVANHAARGGYDAGGLISEPVLGMGLRSGQPYAIGEYGPEYVIGRRATSALGLGPGSVSRGMGGWLAGAHPGGGVGASVVTNITANNVNGSAEVARAIAREQRRLQMLRGV